MKIKQIFFSIFTVLFFVLNTAFAAPKITSISGNVTNGSSITITGNNFGTHSDHSPTESYLPAAWDDLDDGTADSDVYVKGGIYSPGAKRILGGVNRNNSIYCCSGYSWADGANAPPFTNIMGEYYESLETGPITVACLNHETTSSPTHPQIIFASGWYMFPVGFNAAISAERISQSKFLTVRPGKYCNNWEKGKTFWIVNSTGTTSYLAPNYEDGRSSQCLGATPDVITEGEWVRFDIAIDTSRPAGQKICYFYIDGEQKNPEAYLYYNEPPDCGTVGGCDPADGCPRYWHNVTFLQYFQQEGDDTPIWPIYLDDPYVSYTWARVEISESSTWDETARIHKEIQIPTAWASDGTSITITVNQGSFTSCETYYLFVVDADGVPSAGYPVRIVTGSGEKPCKVLDGERISGP